MYLGPQLHCEPPEVGAHSDSATAMAGGGVQLAGSVVSPSCQGSWDPSYGIPAVVTALILQIFPQMAAGDPQLGSPVPPTGLPPTSTVGSGGHSSFPCQAVGLLSSDSLYCLLSAETVAGDPSFEF